MNANSNMVLVGGQGGVQLGVRGAGEAAPRTPSRRVYIIINIILRGFYPSRVLVHIYTWLLS